MTDITSGIGTEKSTKVSQAMVRHKRLSRAGLSERLFGFLFSGLVYPQIWEDPAVDMEAMDIQPHHKMVTIGSGGCNMLAYLSKKPARIDVVDLNRHHVELNRFKLACFRFLPSYNDVVRQFGMAGIQTNAMAFDRYVAPQLDQQSFDYWSKRDFLSRRRITVFNRNIYKTGLLGRFIGLGHIIARLHGVDPREFVTAQSMREQRQFFDDRLAPLFDRRFIRWVTSQKSSLFGLGIPPQQFDELAALSDGKSLAGVLRQRVENLTCRFPLKENYFAWQAFGRRYPSHTEGQLPVYLQEENYTAIKQSAHRVQVHHANFTELLQAKPAQSVDRYVLLDAQDWMTSDQLNALWTEVTRTATPNARVIFRTAAIKSILDGKLNENLLDQWTYLQDDSVRLGKRDRSAIYGGFHIYEKKA